jgi:hypothetical protein
MLPVATRLDQADDRRASVADEQDAAEVGTDLDDLPDQRAAVGRTTSPTLIPWSLPELRVTTRSDWLISRPMTSAGTVR